MRRAGHHSIMLCSLSACDNINRAIAVSYAAAVVCGGAFRERRCAAC